MNLLHTLIQYKAGVAYGLAVSTVTVGVAINEAQSDTGLFGLAPIPGPTVLLSPTATPTVTETRVLSPSPSVSVMTETASPTALPSPTATETLIVPLPVVTTATVTPSATPTPTSSPTPTATRTPRNHANGLDCFVLIEVDNHVEVIKRPCPKESP